MEEIIAPCLEPQPRLAGKPYGVYVHDLAHAPWALWCLGYPDRALKVSRALRALVYSRESFRDIFQVLCDAVCFTHQLRREVRATEEALRELLPICRDERSYPVMRPFATLFLGWVHAQSGALEQGIEELRQGLAGWSAGFVVLRAALAGVPGRGVGAGRAGGGGAGDAGRGAGAGRAHRRGVQPGGAVPAEGGVAAAAGRAGSRNAGRSLLPEGHRRRPRAGGPLLGAARHGEPGPPVAAPGEARGGARRRWPRSMAGSPRGSIPPTCRRPGRCSRSYPPMPQRQGALSREPKSQLAAALNHSAALRRAARLAAERLEPWTWLARNGRSKRGWRSSRGPYRPRPCGSHARRPTWLPLT